MRRAFQLAQSGKFYTSPNPRVGAVVVHDNKIIGEGYHRQYGEAHAEVNAINSVRDKSLLKEATIYVTLEPCSHLGKTPPCADLIIKHQLKKVVIANTDPFAEVNGNGIEKLNKAGIEVITGVLKKEGEKVNRRFFTFHQKKRPYIILKWAQSKDEFIYKDKNSDNWITTAASKQLVHLWRAEEDAILVGTNTVIADNPELTVREVSGKHPVRIIIDKDQKLSKKLKVFNQETETLIINKNENYKKGNIEGIKFDFNRSLVLFIAELCAKKNLLSLFVEGGTKTLQQFIDENMWDEARVLTGNSVFTKGIPAPTIKGNKIIHEIIDPDVMEITLNNNL